MSERQTCFFSLNESLVFANRKTWITTQGDSTIFFSCFSVLTNDNRMSYEEVQLLKNNVKTILSFSVRKLPTN